MANGAPADVREAGEAAAGPGASRARLAAVAAVAAVAAGLTYLVAVRTGWGQQLDEAMKAWWLPARTAWEGEVRPLARLLGAPLLVVTAAAGSAVVIARRRLDALVPLAAIVVGAPVLALVAKHRVLDREVLAEGTFPVVNTLPSGHATVVATAAAVLVWLVPPPRRAVGLALASVLVAGGALLVLVAALHRPSDVAAGYLLAGAWSAGVLALAGRPCAPPHARPTLAVAVVLGSGVLGVAGAVALAAVADGRSADDTSLPVFAAGVGLAAAAGVLVIAALTWAMGAAGVGRRALPGG